MYTMTNRKPAKLDLSRPEAVKEIMTSIGYDYISECARQAQKQILMIFRKNHNYFRVSFSLKEHRRHVSISLIEDMDVKKQTFKCDYQTSITFRSIEKMKNALVFKK